MLLQPLQGPKQAESVQGARTFATATLRPLSGVKVDARKAAEVRLAAAEAGVLGPDVPALAGGRGLGLPAALAVAQTLGEELPRPLSSLVLDGLPTRLLGVSDKTGGLVKACLLGQSLVALADVTGAGVTLDRRPGGNARLSGNVPGLMVPPDCAHVLFVFEDRADSLALAAVSTHHAALRQQPVPGLPLMVMQGVLDVEVPESGLVADCSLEVQRALAAEELLRAARSVGEATSALHAATPGVRSDADARLLADAVCAVLLSRTALHAAAERLIDGGVHTLLGEEARMGGSGAALEARAVAWQALWDAGRAIDCCVQLGREGGRAPSTALMAAFTASRWDVAALAQSDAQRGVWARLGENRLGTLGALRSRTAAKSDSRPPAPATHPTPLPGEPVPERKTQPPARTATGRLALPHAEWGPLPFVPDDVRRFLLDMRKVACEVGSSRVDLQACKLEYSIVSPK